MDKLKRQLIAWLISKLLGDDSKFIIISIKKKELHKLIHNKSSSLDVHQYDIPQFASKEIILNISKIFNENEVMLDRFTYEAEHNINC